MEDTDRWPDTLAPVEPYDWNGEGRVQFNPDDPAKTIPPSWAEHIIQELYRRNPAQFGTKWLAETVAWWAAQKYGGEDKSK